LVHGFGRVDRQSPGHPIFRPAAHRGEICQSLGGTKAVFRFQIIGRRFAAKILDLRCHPLSVGCVMALQIVQIFRPDNVSERFVSDLKRYISRAKRFTAEISDAFFASLAVRARAPF
jgi:hypothetical protein